MNSTSARLNGKPSVGVGVQLAPSANALQTAKLIKQKLKTLEPYFPQGVKASIPYDSSLFIDISISQVVETLIEAVVLVFLVMLAEAAIRRRKGVANPWGEGATTLEWTLSSPPPFHQFNTPPVIKHDDHH